MNGVVLAGLRNRIETIIGHGIDFIRSLPQA